MAGQLSTTEGAVSVSSAHAATRYGMMAEDAHRHSGSDPAHRQSEVDVSRSLSGSKTVTDYQAER